MRMAVVGPRLEPLSIEHGLVVALRQLARFFLCGFLHGWLIQLLALLVLLPQPRRPILGLIPVTPMCMQRRPLAGRASAHLHSAALLGSHFGHPSSTGTPAVACSLSYCTIGIPMHACPCRSTIVGLLPFMFHRYID